MPMLLIFMQTSYKIWRRVACSGDGFGDKSCVSETGDMSSVANVDRVYSHIIRSEGDTGWKTIIRSTSGTKRYTKKRQTKKKMNS